MAKHLRLKIYCDETDVTHGKASFELVVQRAQEIECTHIVVSSGILGGRKGHNASYLAQDLPIIVEIIANEERMTKLLPFVKEVIKNGTSTIEDVIVI